MSTKGAYVDDVTYVRHFVAEQSPARMRLAAALNGITPPSADDFDYLELGCAHGDTITALAAAHPRARFVGVDLLPDHVSSAKRLARDGGVENIGFLERDFAKIADDDLGEFDFIAAHGVLSWIGPDKRAALIELVKRKLKPGGLLYVSYNTLPGWAAVEPLRQLVLAPASGARASAASVDAAARGIAFANDFTLKGTTVESVEARNWYAAVGAVDDGTGLRLAVPPGMTFNVSGAVQNTPVVFTVTPALPNVLSLVVDPVLQQVTLMGSLTGSQSGFTLKLTIHATSDAPFANLPPVANAGPDQTVSTGCYAMVSLDQSKTTDPNGDYSYGYFTEDGDSIGDGSKPIAMLPGLHRITLRAFDKQGARGTDDVVIDVKDDGSAPIESGATQFAVTLPQAVPLDRAAVVAQSILELKPNARIAAGTNVVSFGSASLQPGAEIDSELWVPTPPTLAPNAKITGAVHSTLAPLTKLAWNVVVPSSSGAPITLGPKQVANLAPGNYGDVSLGPNSMLTLRSGTYFATNLTTKPGSTLTIDDSAGPVFLFLRGTIAHQGSIEGTSSQPPSVLAAAHGADVAGPWQGTLLVPDGDVTLGPPPTRDHRGAVFGAAVRVQSRLQQAPFAWDAVRASRAACALRPKVVCVRSVGPNSYVARFDYDNDVEFASVFVPVGLGNRFASGPADRGQPETFLSGLFTTKGKGAFEVPFDGTPLTWVLGARTATASASTAACP